MKNRRTQAQRREETQSLVLQSACRLFGEKGYVDTSVDDIAADCGLTTRPIYHYFGNKQALFTAATEAMSARIAIDLGEGEPLTAANMIGNWRHFLELCDDPHFRRIVLIDAPNILGRQRWAVSPAVQLTHARIMAQAGDSPADQFRLALVSRMIIAALTEAALMVAEADDTALAKQESERLVDMLLQQLPG